MLFTFLLFEGDELWGWQYGQRKFSIGNGGGEDFAVLRYNEAMYLTLT